MTAPSDRDVVERVKAAVDIVDVARSYFPLTAKGERHWALCPFHREKTPSFSILESRQIFHCFGCGKSGDVLTLVMELDRLTFPEALQALAEQGGVDLPSYRSPDGREGRRLEFYDLLNVAAQFYVAKLAEPAGEAARKYAARRGLDRATVEGFNIGFAPDEWRGLRDALRRRGASDEDLLRVGLVKAKEGGQPYDVLRNRFVVPIKDGRGRVIAFGGRVLDDSQPKYLNSPETDLFAKRRVLFGFDRARRAAEAAGFFLVVEGYLDVIAAHQRGIENVVATLGTALTREHATAIKRSAKRVVLLFDGDEAGQRAADRGAPLLLQEDLDVAVATLPAGQDPDDFLRSHDSSEFLRIVGEESEDLIDYLIRRARERQRAEGNDAGTAGTARAAREILSQIGPLRDPIRRDLFLHKISDSFGIAEPLLRQEAGLASGPEDPEEGARPTAPRPRRRLRAFEQDEIAVLQGATTDIGVARAVVEGLLEADFRDPGRRRVFAAVRDALEDGESPTASVVLERLREDPAASAALEAVLGRDLPRGETPEHALERVLGRRKESEYRRLRDDTRESLKATDETDLDAKLAEVERFHAERYRRSKQDKRNRFSGDTL